MPPAPTHSWRIAIIREPDSAIALGTVAFGAFTFFAVTFSAFVVGTIAFCAIAFFAVTFLAFGLAVSYGAVNLRTYRFVTAYFFVPVCFLRHTPVAVAAIGLGAVNTASIRFTAICIVAVCFGTIFAAVGLTSIYFFVVDPTAIRLAANNFRNITSAAVALIGSFSFASLSFAFLSFAFGFAATTFTAIGFTTITLTAIAFATIGFTSLGFTFDFTFITIIKFATLSFPAIWASAI
ncbi:Glycosyltransferase family 5 [Lasiodiplodia theobromae]|uniref:Glycosyltransferase family 5 n=1 Tax=Lasiodiplodia theobromae TaxID=45133 RepID=UPI0015C36DFF|nr:Glycosyltransferase family 5 [Lasiodiplodia theobromae]KAF4534888.1 Glycosyltransferase family 5 [Lasiodiplodia theobromae]